ncbi:toll-like receptor Tollo [Oppia nitens]|uniref:toll-like receptor Tollo n=1 Tax=Oppia nitens TaxID=1686743 RepID=UPI0023DB7156|nr:toll-like receptor Tollo [Oppia nitens]
MFSEIMFENITISNARRLAKLNAQVFGNHTVWTVRWFSVQGQSQLGRNHVTQLFDALSSLVNAREIHLELPELRALPSFALFSTAARGPQSQLQVLSLQAPRVSTIPNYAFYELSNLQWVRVRTDRLARVEAHAFDFDSTTTSAHRVLLTIDLESNQLSTGSLETGSFLHTKRPTSLRLGYNNITRLEAHTYRPFISTNPSNVIDMTGNAIKCDCSIAWLLLDDQRHLYRDRVVNARCMDPVISGSGVHQPNIWSLNATEFNGCQNITTTGADSTDANHTEFI